MQYRAYQANMSTSYKTQLKNVNIPWSMKSIGICPMVFFNNIKLKK